ncbi:hypothetical protein NST41_33450 [Paenibacillus sp. FSL L8-0696]|uniref:hypothetical protein n=1 Tax=Paenibacillus sp. FSL L8-0696 TaxID=2954524 RepID=UPI00311918CB
MKKVSKTVYLDVLLTIFFFTSASYLLYSEKYLSGIIGFVLGVLYILITFMKVTRRIPITRNKDT